MPLLVLALVIALLAVVFALQNAVPITVTLLFTSFRGSLALVLLVTFALGVLTSLLVSVPALIRRNRTIVRLERRVAELEGPPPGAPPLTATPSSTAGTSPQLPEA